MNTLDYILKKFNVKVLSSPMLELDAGGRGNLISLWQELGFKTGAEIGVESGRFSQGICKVMPGVKLYCVDPWEAYPGYREHVSQDHLNKLYKDTVQRTKGYNCEIIRDYSLDAAKQLKDGSLDFVYIDANHDYKNVTNDITAWIKKLRSGGIISGHDYSTSKSGAQNDTIAAVNDYTKTHRISPWFVWLGDTAPSWMWVKS